MYGTNTSLGVCTRWQTAPSSTAESLAILRENCTPYCEAVDVRASSPRSKSGSKRGAVSTILTHDRLRAQRARRGMLDNPLVVFEVLSESTEGIDRGAKFAAYASLRSVRQYVLIDSRCRRVEIYVRTGLSDECAGRVVEDGDGTIELELAGKTIPMSYVYGGVRF